MFLYLAIVWRAVSSLVSFTNGSFSNSKKALVEKARKSTFASKCYLDFNKPPVNMFNKLFDTLFQPILLYGSEIWGAYDSINLKKWEKDPVERLHTQFYKHYLGRASTEEHQILLLETKQDGCH